MEIYKRQQRMRDMTLKTKYPSLKKAVERHLDPSDLEVQNLDLLTLKDGREIYFYETPGHGWFFDAKTYDLIGEEDGGLYTTGWTELKGQATRDYLIE